MRMCNVTLVEITEALARECPSAMKAALGIFLAIIAGGGANAGPDGKEVPRVAFLGFEFINTSLEATAPVEVERIRLLDDVLRQKLTASGHFEIVDIPPDTIKEIASGTTISNCNGCQRRFAQMVGANWAAWGSAEGEQPNPEHQCLHGGCGIRYDEVRPERRHSRQHRRILATGARLFAAQLFVARTLTADALRSEQDLQALSRRYNSS